MSNNKGKSIQGRLASLDALRGLDMFFLVGFAGIFRALPKLADNDFFNWLAYQVTHPEWHGFTAWDVVFPMFIFIVGVAMPFSFSRRLNQEGGKNKLYKHILTRAIILAILGIVRSQSPLTELHPYYGLYSVLYRIGFSYLFASIIMMNTNIRGQIYWAFGILIGYWMLLRFVPVPGYGIGDFSQEGNLVTYIGNLVATYISPDFRVILSPNLTTSISNALLGVLAGHWLMTDKKGTEKTLGLLIAGIGLIIIGLIIHLDFPINKKLYTTSFTFLACGISAVFLSGFYWVIDVKGYKKWSFFFVVVGVNPLTIYLASSLLRFGNIANVFVGGIDFGSANALVFAVTVAAVKWLFLYYLYKQKFFFKI